MRYISLFSGVEAATLAWEPLGWEAVAFAEIEPFPSAVLAERWPDVPNLGDVTKVDWSKYRGAVDVVVGGSPCQAFSVAGKREGLMDTRGQLMLEYVRAVAEVRPRWFLWENVPGVLSQDRGRAFGTLLREMDELGYGMAWRVLDAQFFGVAQRRRRVFLVGHLGGGAGPAAAVLFEPESVSGDTQTGKQKREALAADARSRAQGAGWAIPENVINRPNGGSNGQMAISGMSPTLRASSSVPATMGAKPSGCLTQYGDEIAGTLRARYDSSPTPDNGQNAVAQPSGCLTPWDVQSKRVFSDDACSPTLNRGAGMTTTPSVLAFAQNTRDEVRVQGDGTISGALSAQPGMKQQTYVSFSIPSAAIGAPNSGMNARMAVEEVSPTLKADGKAHAVAEPIAMASGQANAEICEGNMAPTLTVLHEAPLMAMEERGFDVICMADDNAKTAIDHNLSGSLKVGGRTRWLRCL